MTTKVLVIDDSAVMRKLLTELINSNPDLEVVGAAPDAHVAREMIKTLVGKGELVNVRGTYLPLMRLYDVFRLEPELSDPTKAILLILETEGERVAVMVDEILGQQQVVIKSMEQNFRKIEGVAGATILGDGTVGFILDVRGLLNIARQGNAKAA